MRRIVSLAIAFLCGVYVAAPFGIAAVAQTERTPVLNAASGDIEARLEALEKAEAAARAPVTIAQFTALDARVSKLENSFGIAQMQSAILQTRVATVQTQSSTLAKELSTLEVAFKNHYHCFVMPAQRAIVNTGPPVTQGTCN